MYFLSICSSSCIMEGKIAWLIIYNIRFSACEEHMRNCQMSTIIRHTFRYQLETIIATPWCIHRNGLLLQIELSGCEGCVRCAQGADFSLNYCLATSIWTIAPKAISGSKTRGTSLGTTVWPHVQVIRREQRNKGRETRGRETQMYGRREKRVMEAGGYDTSAPPPTLCHTSKSHYCH